MNSRSGISRALSRHLSTIGRSDFRAAALTGDYLPAFKAKLKLTRRCNLRCSKCQFWRTATPDRISTARAIGIIEEMRSMGLLVLKLSGGEVLLRHDLLDILRHAANLGIRTSITTNGTLLDSATAVELVAAGVSQITISVDSHQASVHDELVGVPGAQASTLQAFDHIREAVANSAQTTRVVLQSVLSRRNLHQIEQIARLAAQKADALSIIPFHRQSFTDNTLALHPDDVVAFVNKTLPRLREHCDSTNLELINSGLSTMSVKRIPYYSENPCFQSHLGYRISASGLVSPCCFCSDHTRALGSVFRESLGQILQGEAFRRFRRSCFPRCTREFCHSCTSDVHIASRVLRWLETDSADPSDPGGTWSTLNPVESPAEARDKD